MFAFVLCLLLLVVPTCRAFVGLWVLVVFCFWLCLGLGLVVVVDVTSTTLVVLGDVFSLLVVVGNPLYTTSSKRLSELLFFLRYGFVLVWVLVVQAVTSSFRGLPFCLLEMGFNAFLDYFSPI